MRTKRTKPTEPIPLIRKIRWEADALQLRYIMGHLSTSELVAKLQDYPDPLVAAYTAVALVAGLPEFSELQFRKELLRLIHSKNQP